MNIPLETIKKSIQQGFVISLWEEKRKRGYSCEISKPSWAGSVVETDNSISKAIKKAWKAANEV